MVDRTEPLASILQRRNAVRDIAAACGISTAAVAQWRRIPDRHHQTVAALFGLDPSDLRVATPRQDAAA